ncbi:unnamed protein product [Spodoptera littoralis]|uniref:Uncharacterized protein n=1 Tax=Spodoptera littoralis TaxID=7109 RepID=A0A9P0IDU7_SPOLI|nr:unnamed protein product [Spodoptera littoralis]CAH1643365.1 unnamed protein product [Spodoptera littoralis]
MLTAILHIFCVVFPAQAVLWNFDEGPIHIYKNARGPSELEDSPLSPRDEAATQNAKIFLQQFLPTLDTTLMRSVNRIHLRELNTVVALYLYNFMVNGFQQATLDNLTVRLGGTIRLDFNLSFPSLTTDGIVFVNGLIDQHHFASIANLSTVSNDVKVSGVLTVATMLLPSNINVFQIVDAAISIDVSKILISLEIIQELVDFQITLMEFTNKRLEDIVNSISRVVFKLINEELAQVPAISVIDYLISKQQPKPSDKNRNLHLRSERYVEAYPYYSYEYINE